MKNERTNVIVRYFKRIGSGSCTRFRDSCSRTKSAERVKLRIGLGTRSASRSVS